MAAACSVSPFLINILNVTFPRRDTWVGTLLPFLVLLWIYLFVYTLLPILLHWYYTLPAKLPLFRLRATSLWFIMLLSVLPYTTALSAGLTVKWIPLPAPREHHSSSRFLQDGWGTACSPTTPEVSIQERLRRESASSVRAFVASNAYDNNLVASYHMDDRINRDAGLLNKRKRREDKRHDRDTNNDTSEPGWDTSDDTDTVPTTGWYFPTTDGWTSIYKNPDATVDEELQLESRCAAAAFELFVANNKNHFNPEPEPPADREPPDKPDKPHTYLPVDLFSLDSQYDRTPLRRNKYGLPDVRPLYGNHIHGPEAALRSKAYHTISNPPAHLQSLLATDNKCRFSVCMDSGCTKSVTPSLDDFESPPVSWQLRYPFRHSWRSYKDSSIWICALDGN